MSNNIRAVRTETMRIVVDQKNSFVAAAFSSIGDLRVLPTREITKEELRDADAVIVRAETKIGASLLEGTAVRFVGTATIGTDHVDLAYLRKKGIGFASAPGSNAESVAQYLSSGILAVAERLGWKLAGRTLGVVGVGNVGTRVVRMAKGLGMRVLKNDPPLARSTGDPTFLPLEALLEADILTLHVPLTASGPDPTVHLVGTSLLKALKPGAVLINTSRGAVVEEEAFLKALTHGKLAGAIVDTWDHEPFINPDLLAATTIGTPHVAGYSLDGKLAAARMMFDAVCVQFGLDNVWEFSGELPGPRSAEIHLDRLPGDNQAAERAAVKACYDIEGDDMSLRGTLGLPEGSRASLFSRMRSEYPVRREFSATSIVGAEGRQELAGSLKALGFSVR